MMTIMTITMMIKMIICRGECSLYQTLAFGYEAVQGGVDNAQGLCTAALTWHNGPQGSNVPIGNEGRAAVLCFPQSRVDSLQRVAACLARVSLFHLAIVCWELIPSPCFQQTWLRESGSNQGDLRNLQILMSSFIADQSKRDRAMVSPQHKQQAAVWHATGLRFPEQMSFMC